MNERANTGMRKEFENLKSGSALARLAYWTLRFLGGILTSERRQHVKAWFFKVTRHRPSFCRRVKEWGLSKTPRSPRVIVSLTSYPKRIGTVHRTIETLLTQTFKPDLVVLWLGEDKFPNKEADLPQSVLRLRDFGLLIGWTKDIRSYTKLVPALKAYPDDIIVTADDDVFYQANWLELLYRSYEKDKDAIHCQLVRRITVVHGKVGPYSTWAYGTEKGCASALNLLMGVAGVLYPPHSLHEDVLREDLFKDLSPMADDLWFWAMAVLAERQIKLIENALPPPEGDCAADMSEALLNMNTGTQHLNDKQFERILQHYPELRGKIV